VSTIGWIDWVITLAFVAASWQLFQVMQPRPPDGSGEKAAGTALYPPRLGERAGAPPTLEETLRQIREAGGFAELGAFMRGARLAYEAVIDAFAMGDTAPIAGWLGAAVRKGLDDAIAARQGHGEQLSTTFIGFTSADAVAAGIDDGWAWIDVRFVAQMIAATSNADGQVVAGDPRRVDTVAEVWTFSRELGSRDPNWMLVATEAEG
jgi:predicted lipid-binding transport protein (Tim44 family)